jgi:molybdate transport system permease protein
MTTRRARTPWPHIPFAAVAVAFVVIPFAALLQRAPWSDLGDLLGQPIVADALRLSITTALAATALSLLFGVPLAWILARTTFPGRSALRALVTLPMVLPPVVGGAALLFAFGRRGLLGGPISRWRPACGPPTPATRTRPRRSAPAAGSCSAG